MGISNRVVLVLAATAVVTASFAFVLLSVTDANAALVAAPFAFAAVVGLLALALGAAVANALAGPEGPQGPDEPTAADQRRDDDEWNDPPGLDLDDDDR